MSTVFVRGLRAEARVGVKLDELSRHQPIEIDIEIELGDLTAAARSEQLADTLDYEQLASRARAIVAERHFPLVESLAGAIAQDLARRPRVHSVRVRLHKLGCLPNATAAGAEIVMAGASAAPEPIQPLAFAHAPARVEIAIVGGGVAGLAAALWCARLDRPALVIDAAANLGGQLDQVYFPMPDLPGLEPLAGDALARRMCRQFRDHGGRWLQAELTGVSADDSGVDLDLAPASSAAPADARRLRASVVIIATGLRRRRLEVPGEERLAGRGLLATGSRDTDRLRGEHVVVVGGGDSASENALKLARAGAEVTLLYRRDQLGARRAFRQRIAAEPRIRCWAGRRVARFVGEHQLEAVELDSGERVATRWALVRIGWRPNTEGLPRDWLDARGGIEQRDLHVAGERRVLCAGDVRLPEAPSVATAAGDGACAAKSAALLLEREESAASTRQHPR